MTDTKTCEQCGKTFPKNCYTSRKNWLKVRFCSTDCKVESQRGRLSPLKGRSYGPSQAQRIPCRICGEPTKYHGGKNHPHKGKVHCGSDECKEASRLIRNERIQATLKDNPPTPNGNWHKVTTRIGKEEAVIEPFMTSLGFEPQLKVLTNVSSVKLPRYFKLDFGHQSKKLAVEIDGSIHRLRQQSDARKDAMLIERGWRVLRINAKEVTDNLEQVQGLIQNWID